MRIGIDTPTGKLLASAAVIAAAAAVAGLGTFGSFTSTTSASTVVSSGTVSISLGAVGAANRLSVAATGLVPTDTISRAVDLSSSASSQNLASITLTTTASPTSALDTNTTYGLQLAITKCTNAWTETGVSPAYSYTCSGSTSTVLASTPVIQSTAALSNLGALTAGTTDHLLVTMTLPAGTAGDNTLQGLTSTLTFAFTGTQRAGSAH